MKFKCLLFVLVTFGTVSFLNAQNGIIRGNVYDQDSGEPIMFGTVVLEGTDFGTNTDIDGFFSFSNLEDGSYTIQVSYVGYDTKTLDVEVKGGNIVYRRIMLVEGGVQLDVVQISARKEKSKSEVKVSSVTLSPKQIQALPSTGGEPDLAQYLSVLPGVVTTGDQGGQLYIRGGAPIQNLILLDGLQVFNPFHSIGLFSVFETETIRTADVLTGGFNAEYGGRISAVVDIKTREGNKKRLGGLVSASPFMAKALVEGPLKKLSDEGGGSSSFILTGKRSYIDQTSRTLYSYANAVLDSTNSLPFNFTDLYGKLSFLTGNGTKLNVFGFNFSDQVNYSAATLDWNTLGGGVNFTVVPPNSNLILGGTVGFSDYQISLVEGDGNTRESSLNNISAQLDFSYFGNNSQVKYGFIFNGISTDFVFENFLGNEIQQQDFTTELAGFVVLRQKLGNLILEPSLRAQLYASQSTTSLEPRFGAKFNATDFLRFKFGTGLYSQNILSSVNEQDVVNLFVGFLTGPEETIFLPGTTTPTNNRLQKAFHAIGGVEFDVGQNLELNLEGYYKGFTQLIYVNRNKLSASDPDFATETGQAYGVDFSLRYELPRLYLWTTYSLGYVRRDDGEQVYPTIFDRRHNVNVLVNYALDEEKTWEFGLRWNYGSPLPFTQTQGFYPSVDFISDGLGTDPKTENPDLGIIFAAQRNGGRLIPYHRLDVSLKKTIEFNRYTRLEITAAATNLYNRQNVFFIDRTTNERVDQLPILPSLAASFYF
jgi:hypothetical protein